MGLDMFIKKRFYVGGQYEHRNVTGTVKLSIEGKEYEFNPKEISGIEFSVYYWRKANWFHKWFVDNVQGGNDDCGDYDVSLEKFEALLSVINQVLADRGLADQLLPTEDGFFFGDTKYSEYYFEDLADTKTFLESEIEKRKADKSLFDYYYHSSW